MYCMHSDWLNHPKACKSPLMVLPPGLPNVWLNLVGPRSLSWMDEVSDADIILIFFLSLILMKSFSDKLVNYKGIILYN